MSLWVAAYVIAPKDEPGGRAPRGKVFRVDQLPQIPPWNRVLRRIRYVQGDELLKDVVPFTFADPMDPLGCQDWPIVDNEPT